MHAGYPTSFQSIFASFTSRFLQRIPFSGVCEVSIHLCQTSRVDNGVCVIAYRLLIVFGARWTHRYLRLLAIKLVISSTPFYKFIDTESCPLCHHVLNSFSRSLCSLVLPQGVVALTSLRDFYSKNIDCRQTFFSLNTLIISELNTNPSEA